MLLVEYNTSCVADGYRRPSSTNKRPGSVATTASCRLQRSRSQLQQRRKMTRSAPPARTISPTKHISGSRDRKPKSTADVSISIEDIYQSAERERLSYSSACRRQNLAHAQSQTQFFRTEQNASSRPNTSASRNINSFRRENATPASAWSDPLISRPSSIIPHPELKNLVDYSDSDSDDDNFEMNPHTPMTVTFSPVSRDCCEIIGPQMCYECRKNRIRQVSKDRSSMCFPILDPSEDNLTTAAIVRKYLPGLSDPEIENKLARGEIARPSIRRQNNKTVEFSDEEDDLRSKITNKKVTIVDHRQERKAAMSYIKTSDLFFSDIRDLNSKIISGSIDRNVGFMKPGQEPPPKKVEYKSKNHFPTFVSPRKVKMVQETNYKTYFAPPLIAKDKQDVEPQFFAGSSGEYTLPEKLPDELVFVDKNGKEVKASDSKSFTVRESATSESGLSDVQVKAVTVKIKPLKDDLSMLAEEDEIESRPTSAIPADACSVTETASVDTVNNESVPSKQDFEAGETTQTLTNSTKRNSVTREISFLPKTTIIKEAT